MKLEFKVYQLKDDSKMYEQLVTKSGEVNEFAIVGEEKLSDDYDCYKVQQLGKNGIVLVGGLTIEQFSFLVKKDELELKSGLGIEIQEFEVPRQYLTIEIIENIQRLNA